MLGKRKITFQAKANSLHLNIKLEAVYPKLKDGGGFDILRRGVQASELIMIKPPRSGYSVPYLRDIGGLGQADAFIRPIQCNLNVTPSEIIDSREVSIFLMFIYEKRERSACLLLISFRQNKQLIQ